jgi:hypothetical protein
LDGIVPGLGQLVETDFPKVICWTDAESCTRFRTVLLERVKFPESASDASRWLLLSGDVAAPAGRYHLAVAVVGEQPVAARILEVPDGRWADFVSVRNVPIEERGL